MTKLKSIIFFFVFMLVCLPAHATISMAELGDSLTVFAGYSSFWASPIKVKNIRVNRNNVTVRATSPLKDLRWTPELVAEAKRNVSRWVLGHEKGKVTLIGGKTNIETLVTNCAKGIMPAGKQSDLTERNIALYPSHGLYYNRHRDEWIWQRATLWTTVEDLYSQEYVRHIRRMLENAGATVYMPRAGLEQQETGLSGMPQWTEGARYWLISQGADSTLWDLFEGDEYKDDMKCRAMWINSLDVPIDLCLALHTDGMDSGNDTAIVGTLAIYTARDDDNNTKLRDKRDREQVNRNLADWIQTQVTEDLQHMAPKWTRRQLREANYCESRVPVVPSLILELLSHKNMADMRYGLDPQFRFVASRAVYKGILRYLNGKSAVVQPLPVKEIGVQLTKSGAVLQWQAETDSLEPTATPNYYMVYVQENDGEWDVQQVNRKTRLEMEMKRGVRYNYYVVAGNEGGLSYPSPMVSAYLSEREESPMALVVDAFDEVYGVEWFTDSTFAGIVPGSYACEDGFSCAYIGQQWDYRRSSLWTNDDNCGWGACYRDHAGQLTVGNTHDWSVRHGYVLRRMRISYCSCTEGMLSKLLQDGQMSRWNIMDVVCGRNRVPLRTESMTLIAEYLNQGGRLLISSDHLSATDKDWLAQQTHTRYYAGQATRSGRVIGKRHRLYQMLLEPNEEQLFTCHPEGLQATDSDAVCMATYEDMRCPAAIGYRSVQNDDKQVKTLVYGFPLEAIMEFDKIYRHSIEWLLE